MKNYILSTIILLNFFCFAVFGQKDISTEISTTSNSFEACREKAMQLSRMKKYIKSIKTIEEWLDKTDKKVINEDIISAYEFIILVADLKAENNKIKIANMERLLSFLNRKEIIADKSLTASICFTIAWYNHDIKDQKIRNRFYDTLIAYRRKKLNEAKKTKQKEDILSCYDDLIKILSNAKKPSEAMLMANEALKFYEENITNDDGYPHVYTNLSKLYVERKEYSKAVKILRRFIKVYKEDIYKPWIYIRIAKVYIKSKDCSSAQKALEKALLNNTKSAGCDRSLIQDNFLQIGKVYCDIRQYKLAVKYIEKSDKKSPFYSENMANVYFNWGEYLASQGKWEKAIKKLQNAIKWTDKNDFESQCDLLLAKVFCYSNLEEFKKAHINLKNAFDYVTKLPPSKKDQKHVELFQKQILLYLQEASYLRRKRKFIEAKNSLIKASNVLKAVSDKKLYKEILATIYLSQGWLCHDQEKFTDALKCYQKAINVYNTDFDSKYTRAAEIYLHLAGAYQNNKLAEKYYKKALNIANKNDILLQATIHYFFGIYYCNNKRYKSGLKNLQKAVEKLKTDDNRFSKKIKKINSKIKYYKNISI